MSDFVKDLETQLRNVLPANKSTKVRKNMDTNNNNTLVYGIIILVLAGACYFAYTYKVKTPPAATNNWQQSASSSMSYPNLTQPWANTDTSTNAEIEALKRRYDAIYGATSEIWNRTKWNSDRMTLLATLNNHNLVVIQNNLPKNEIILLNEDWTINRMPDRIRLDAADQEFIRKFIRR